MTATTTPAERHVYGPYDTDLDTYDEPMPTQVRQLHHSGRVRSGDPDGLVRDAVLEALLKACHGIEIGAYDTRILTWFAGWESSTVQVMIGVITRVAAAARRGMAEEIARALEEPPAMSNREITAMAEADDDDERSAAVMDVVLGYAAGVARRVGGIER